MRGHATTAIFGLALGFALSWMGFADWGEVHRMFTFADWRLFLTFMVGVAGTGIGILILPPHRSKGRIIAGKKKSAGHVVVFRVGNKGF